MCVSLIRETEELNGRAGRRLGFEYETKSLLFSHITQLPYICLLLAFLCLLKYFTGYPRVLYHNLGLFGAPHDGWSTHRISPLKLE